MRFERFSIPAFGRFKNLELKFAPAAHDLQVIYGPNEAGKSTLLRAIRGLLFGIDARTQDNFLHDYDALLIGAEVSDGLGHKLSFYRRKGNRKTLLDANKQELPDDALAGYLGVVDASYFSTMFGMGSDELRERGRAVLAGNDKLGEVLFSASMGGTPVERVIASLREEAEKVFRGKASVNVSLRPALKEFDALMKASKEAIVKPDDWAKLEAEWSEAQEKKRTLSTTLTTLKTQHEWLTRCQDALPTMAMLDEAETQLNALTDVPSLTTIALQQAYAAIEQLRVARGDVKRLESDTVRIKQARDGCAVRPEILAASAAIEQLHQELGVYKQQRKASPALEAEVTALEQALRMGMVEFELSGDVAKIESLRLPKAAEAVFKESAKLLNLTRAKVEASRTKLAEVEAELAVQEQHLRQLSEQGVESLRAALAETEGVAELLRAVPEAETRLRKEERAVASTHAMLFGAPKDFAATRALIVPGKAVLRRYQKELEAVSEELRIGSLAKAAALDAERAANDALAALQRGRHIPSLDDLMAARAARDEAWRLVLQQLDTASKGTENTASTARETFREALLQADAIADALHEHAQSVADAERFRHDAMCARRDINAAQSQLDNASVLQAEWQVRWVQEWQTCGIAIGTETGARTTAEMEEWREQWLAFGDAFDAAQHSMEQLTQHRERIARAEALLSVAELGLTEEGNKITTLGLNALLASARKRVQTADEAAGQRRAALRTVDDLRGKRAAMLAEQSLQDKALADAMSSWTGHCAMLGLPAETSPDAGLELATGRAKLVELAAQCAAKQRALNVMREAITGFETEARTTGDALGVTVASAEALEAALWQALVEARAAQARQDEFSTQLTAVERSLAAARVAEDDALDSLTIAQQLAFVSEPEQLPAALEAIAKKASLIERAETMHASLRGQARGSNVEEFVTRVRAEEAATLSTRLSECVGEIAESSQQLEAQTEIVRLLDEQKAKYEQAADDAANHRQQAESKAASVINDAARFVRLQLAISLLERQIETFRKANQGPLLKRSGEIFARFTRNSFAGLGVAFEANDEPVLTGLRSDGKSVRVEGMSEGTRDQLYLALRFAGLERHLTTHTAMPLILDDLFITFDDERAAAILPALAELSQKTQVLLFTHHQHLVELCQRVLPGQCALHVL